MGMESGLRNVIEHKLRITVEKKKRLRQTEMLQFMKCLPLKSS